MDLKTLWRRKDQEPSKEFSERILVEDQDLQKELKTWLEHENWRQKDLEKMFVEAKVSLPIQLVNFQSRDLSFEGKSKKGDTYQFRMQYGDMIDFCTELEVTNRETTKRYLVSTNAMEYRPKRKLTLQEKIIQRGERKLTGYYCRFFCNWKMELPNGEQLTVEIDEPQPYQEDEEKLWIVPKGEEIESYLFSLYQPERVENLYEAFVQILHLTPQMIATMDKLHFVYSIDQKVQNEILLSNGKMQRYAVTENGKTYQVARDSSWSYRDEVTQITYSWGKQEDKSNAKIQYTLIGESAILVNDPKKTLEEVKARISELQNKVTD